MLQRCEHIIFVKAEGVSRTCRHPGRYHTGGKFVCGTHDPRAEAEIENRRRDRRAKEKVLSKTFRKHSVSNREIIDGIIDRALTMLRSAERTE